MPSPPSKKCPRVDRKHLPILDPAHCGDKAHVLDVIKQNVSQIQHASKDLLRDEDFMLEIIGFKRTALKYATELAGNQDFMLRAMQVDVKVLVYLSEDLKSDEEFFEQAFFYNVNALCYASKRVLQDFDIPGQLRKLFWKNPGNFDRRLENLKVSQKDAALYLLEHATNALAIVSETLKADEDVVMAAWVDGIDVRDDESPLHWCDPVLYERDAFVMKMLVKAPNNAHEILYMREGKDFGVEFYIEACKRNEILTKTLPSKALSAIVLHFLRA